MMRVVDLLNSGADIETVRGWVCHNSIYLSNSVWLVPEVSVKKSVYMHTYNMYFDIVCIYMGLVSTASSWWTM